MAVIRGKYTILANDRYDNNADSLIGTSSNDTIIGDVYSAQGNDFEFDTIDADGGDDIIYADADAASDPFWDQRSFAKLNPPWGTPNGARGTGGAGNDTFYGGGARDEFFGGTGNDVLYGFFGGDKLQGQDGNDFVEGGADDDVVSGGRGQDRMLFEAETAMMTSMAKPWKPIALKLLMIRTILLMVEQGMIACGVVREKI